MPADPEIPCPPLGARSTVYRWSDLPEPVREWWARAGRAANTVQQTLGHADAVAAALGSNCVHVAVHCGLLSAFRQHEDRASCVFAGRPILGGPPDSRLRELAELVRTALGAPVVYFPHVTSAAASGLVSWRRRDSPTVTWTEQGRDLPERVRRRYGSRADRQWRRFQAAGLTTAPASGTAAVAVLDTIERRSWKAMCGQSMHDRDQQFELYSGLLDRNLVTLDVAWHGRRPVAYRLDARMGRTVACVKWSFDEAYRRSSPGFYLLTEGLVRRWGPVELDLIDLFGGPDTLKDMVASGAVPRYDLAWPPGSAADELRAERSAFDHAARDNHTASRGVRHLYQGSIA
ncbi:MAG: GNAT family N-acetyltransferase [Pseudonocardiaceae bacterium]